MMPATPMGGREARRLIRTGGWRRPTAELAPGFVQANLVIVGSRLADAFEEFCQLNPRPLPLLERLERGSTFSQTCAPGANVATDIPLYRIYERGKAPCDCSDLQERWQDDWCAFLLGCSFTFDSLLLQAAVPVRHVEQCSNVPMYVTNRKLVPCGPFSGRLVVSMRPVPEALVSAAVALTEPLTMAHGAPLHVGRPEALGIADLDRTDFGDPVRQDKGDVPVFWACGVTAQQAAVDSQIPWMITHAPGHMFITDLRVASLASQS